MNLTTNLDRDRYHWVATDPKPSADATLTIIVTPQVPVGPTTATIALWAKNMFDERYFSFALAGTVAGAIQATAAPPATFGIDISVKY